MGFSGPRRARHRSLGAIGLSIDKRCFTIRCNSASRQTATPATIDWPFLRIDDAHHMISRQQLRDRANAIARTTLSPIPLAFWEYAFPKDVIALCYHVVSDVDLPHLQLYPYKTASQFEADVIFSRERAATYRQVVERRLRGSQLPSNSILFTFDDGLASCHNVIRPILKRNGVDAVFFVTTDYLDDAESFFECELSLCLWEIERLDSDRARSVLATLNSSAPLNMISPERQRLAQRRMSSTRLKLSREAVKREIALHAFGLSDGDEDLARLAALLGVDIAKYAEQRPMFMTRDEVRRLIADGFTVGAHGRKHRSFEVLTPEEIEREIVASCDAVRAITGQERIPFAFPYSGLGVDRQLIADILKRHSTIEMVFDSGCLRNDPNFIVNRVFADDPAGSLDADVSSVPGTLRDAWSVPSAWFRRG